MKNHRQSPATFSRAGGSCFRAFACLVLLCFAAPAHPTSPDEIREKDYLDHKKAGDYAGALDVLRGWSAGIADPALAEVNVFRIGELMAYPELYGSGLETLSLMRDRAPSRPGFLRDRIDITMNELLLKKGALKSAERTLERLSFMDFSLMGPFACEKPEDFAPARCPEQAAGPGMACTGRHGDETWFHADPDRTGTIDIDALNGETGGSLYYFKRTLDIGSAGTYYLVIGKTGYTDIWIDGSRVFSDRTRHGFDHDQYFIPVALAEGAHRLLVKAGASADGIRFAARIVKGETEARGPGPANFDPPALTSLARKQDSGPADWFRAGYLIEESRRRNQDDTASDRLLSRVPESHPLFAAACFYRARACADDGSGDRFYAQSLSADPGNLESLRGLALGALRRGLPYEASPHIDRMKSAGPAPCWHNEALALLCMMMGWDGEALTHAAALKRSPVPSAGLRVEADVFRSRGDAFHETQALERLRELDCFDRSVFLSLGTAYEKKGDEESALQLYQHAVALFPNDTAFRLRLAALVRSLQGPGASLPCLAAAMNAAPGNAAVLSALGMVYLDLGKSAPAEHYLRMALRRTPGDKTIRLNLEILESDRAATGGPRR
jgi:tetratricopeptide (TPR) repeat protein